MKGSTHNPSHWYSLSRMYVLLLCLPSCTPIYFDIIPTDLVVVMIQYLYILAELGVRARHVVYYCDIFY